MGLAASQARLLLLTARKSDLEYRAQMICQRKTMLAMQTEELATNYSKALNNRKLYFTYTASQNDGVTKEVFLSYDEFTSTQNSTQYRLIDSTTGKIACKSLDEASKYVFKQEGESDEAYDERVEKFKKESMIQISALKNSEYLQDAMQSGALLIQELNTTSTPKTDEDGTPIVDANGNQELIMNREWNTVALSGMDDVSSKLYQDDDAAASATYEYQSLLVQNQDKQLDVELKQVETQQKACENEIESVKKVMDKNIESSFKCFS